MSYTVIPLSQTTFSGLLIYSIHSFPPCSLGLSATSQQYFFSQNKSAISQQYFSLKTEHISTSHPSNK
jgi:hypothetical protein